MMSCRKNRAIVCSIVPVLALMGAALIVAVSQASGSGAAASAAQKKACTPSLTKRSRSPAYAHTPWPTERMRGEPMPYRPACPPPSATSGW
jgi:hypothetical protein